MSASQNVKCEIHVANYVHLDGPIPEYWTAKNSDKQHNESRTNEMTHLSSSLSALPHSHSNRLLFLFSLCCIHFLLLF